MTRTSRIAIIAAATALSGCAAAPRQGLVAAPQAAPPRSAPSTSSNAASAAAWFFPALHATSALASYGAIQPIRVTAVAQAQAHDACSPVQVLPGVWFAPDCGDWWRRVSESVAVPVRSFQAARTAELPSEVDLRSSRLDGPVKYQQMVGVCWAFALSTVMDNALRRADRQDVVSPLHVVAAGVWDEIWSRGGSTQSIAAETTWPYDPVKACKLNESKSEIWCGSAYEVSPGSWRSDPELVAERARANAAGAFRTVDVQKLATPINPDQLVDILATGQSIWMAFDYNRDAWGSMAVQGDTIPDYSEGQGGHAVVVVGYRRTEHGRHFLLHNSWSADWRAGGYAWISEAMVHAHAIQGFTVDVATTGTVPAPQPGRTDEPGGGHPPASCPSGQQRDSVLGNCRAACPNGTVPAAGFCVAQSWVPTCAGRELPDLVTRTCTSPCPSGLPRAAGMCAF